VEKLMVRKDMAADLITTAEEFHYSLLEECMVEGSSRSGVLTTLEGSKSGRSQRLILAVSEYSFVETVWKERAAVKVKRMRGNNVPPGTEWKRERLTYLVSSLLGLHVVPPTVIRKVNGVLGSCQAFLPDTKTWKASGLTYEDVRVEEWQRLALLDWLCCNTDRHASNWLVGDNNQFWAIDNGLCFPDATEYGVFRGYRSRPHQMLSEHGDLDIPSDGIQGITPETIQACHDELVRFGVAKAGRIIFLRRLDYLKRYGGLPVYRDAGKGFMRGPQEEEEV
jgi:hypothetical protein